MQGTNLPIDGSNEVNVRESHSLAFPLLASFVAHLMLLTVVSESRLIAIQAPPGARRNAVLAAHIAPAQSEGHAPRGNANSRQPKPATSPESAQSEIQSPASANPPPQNAYAPPRIVSEIDPDVGAYDDTGAVIIRIDVDRFGKAKRLTVEHSTVSRATEEQIVLRFYRARYEPGTRDGQPIDSSIRINITIGQTPANAPENQSDFTNE